MNQINAEALFNLLSRVAVGDLEIFEIAEGKALGFWNDIEVVAALVPSLDIHINGACQTQTVLQDGSVLDWDLEATYIKIEKASRYLEPNTTESGVPLTEDELSEI